MVILGRGWGPLEGEAGGPDVNSCHILRPIRRNCKRKVEQGQQGPIPQETGFLILGDKPPAIRTYATIFAMPSACLLS